MLFLSKGPQQFPTVPGSFQNQHRRSQFTMRVRHTWTPWAWAEQRRLLTKSIVVLSRMKELLINQSGWTDVSVATNGWRPESCGHPNHLIKTICRCATPGLGTTERSGSLRLAGQPVYPACTLQTQWEPSSQIRRVVKEGTCYQRCLPLASTCTYAHICIYAHTCIHICIHIYTCIHTHTHTIKFFGSKNDIPIGL